MCTRSPATGQHQEQCLGRSCCISRACHLASALLHVSRVSHHQRQAGWALPAMPPEVLLAMLMLSMAVSSMTLCLSMAGMLECPDDRQAQGRLIVRSRCGSITVAAAQASGKTGLLDTPRDCDEEARRGAVFHSVERIQCCLNSIGLGSWPMTPHLLTPIACMHASTGIKEMQVEEAQVTRWQERQLPAWYTAPRSKHMGLPH